MAKPYDPKDFYYRKAKKQGLRARSAFKIDEILRRHQLLRRGDAVLDLGAAPGGFLQILADEVGERGVAVGVDLVPIRNLGKAWVRTAEVDLLAPDAFERIRALHPGRFRLVTSDMAPKTIGIKVTDEARSLELVRMALSVAERTLTPGGAFVAKVFMGGDFPPLKKELATKFAEVHVVRPEATREHSFEVYVLGKGYRPQRPAATAEPSAEVAPAVPPAAPAPAPAAAVPAPPVVAAAEVASALEAPAAPGPGRRAAERTARPAAKRGARPAAKRTPKPAKRSAKGAKPAVKRGATPDARKARPAPAARKAAPGRKPRPGSRSAR